jgi:hypothetical protein
MPHLPPAHHKTSKHDSPYETKIRIKLSKCLGFKFKPRQVNDSSQLSQGTDHLVFQNTIRSTTTFTPPYENSPKTTPPPKNPISTQPLEHHSPQYCSTSHSHSLKSPRHTTPPLQNLPTEQAPQQRSSPHVHYLKPSHTTPPLQNLSTE